MIDLANNNKVSIFFIPAQLRIPGNENADNAAIGKAQGSYLIGPLPFIGMVKVVYKNSISEFAKKKFGKLQNGYTFLHTKSFLKLEDRKNGKTYLGLTRRGLQDIVSIVSGLCRLSKLMLYINLLTVEAPF